MEFKKFDLNKIAKGVFNTSLAVSLLGLFFAIVILWSMCFVYVRPYEYGVKQVNIGIQRGIHDKVYTPGLHFVMPFGFEEMHIFPKNLQIFELTNNPLKKLERNEKAANIQTSDGFFVHVDVSIIYKIIDPIKVIKAIGPGKLYIENGIMPKAEPILKDSLGKLTTEEFYNPHLRVEKMTLARDMMNESLISKGIGVEEVLIRYFQYSKEIQLNIEEKKLKDQLVFKNKAEAKAAFEAAKLAKVIKEGEANVKIELEKGNAYKVVKNAERDLYVRTKKAAADLLITKAEAEKTRLKNIALRGLGSENLVGLKMADVIDGIEVIILPSDGKNGINPLNLDAMITLFD